MEKRTTTNGVTRNPVRNFADGFVFAWRGTRRVRRVKGAWWLMGLPVVLNLAIFALTFQFAVRPVAKFAGQWLTGAHTSVIFSVLAWVAAVLIGLVALILYALVFSVIAEILGGPFYEELGARVDREEKQAIVERTIWQEVKLAVLQESQKLVLIVGVGLFGFVLGFVPIVGPVVSATLGFVVLVLTAGADAVGPPLARRGLLLPERRAWVLNNVGVVLGLGCAKALGLVIPVLNVVVLPVTSVGGTLLVQKYDAESPS